MVVLGRSDIIDPMLSPGPLADLMLMHSTLLFIIQVVLIISERIGTISNKPKVKILGMKTTSDGR